MLNSHAAIHFCTIETLFIPPGITYILRTRTLMIAFPENIGERQGLRSVRPDQVLGIVYCFGGVSAVLVFLSKFVITPLFDELTFERRLFVDDARNRVVHLNSLLSRIVKEKPLTVSGLTERSVPAVEGSVKPTRFKKDADKKVDEMIAELRDLRFEAQQIDPNDSALKSCQALTNQANELAKYIRQLQFETVPTSTVFLPPIASGEPNKASSILGQAIVDCTKEIRSFKSSVLS